MFQKIKDTVDIVQHIGQHVELRHGSPMSARCPFHEERTPSFKVWPDHWYCFGCGEGGSVIDFEMRRQNLSAVDAARYLCLQYNIVVDPADAERYTRTEAMKKAKADIMAMLPQANLQMPDRLDYLRKERGFSDQTIKDLGLGVGIRENVVVVPIKDKYGRPIAFAKRYLDPEQAKLHKWVNDPESEVYKKATILYNLDQARRHLSHDQRLVLVESYFDVAALWEAGIKTGAAYCSAQLTKEQAHEIRQIITPGTTLLFGACNDETAQKKLLVNRTLIRSLCPEVHLRAVCIPSDCKDLNDVLVKHGADRLRQVVGESVPMDRYLVDRVIDSEPTVDIQYRRAREVIQIAENPLSQRDLISHLSKRWGKDEETVSHYMLGQSTSQAPIRFRNIPELIAEYEKYVRSMSQQKISWGWEKFDGLTRGIRPADVVQMIASAGTGKTMWAEQLMLSIGQASPHIPMIFYSMEQRDVMAFERFMQMEGGLKSSEVERWIVPGDDAHNSRIFSAAHGLSRKLQNLLITDKSGLTLADIESHTREAGFAWFGKPVGVIFIDYLGYVKSSGNHRSIYEMVSMIAREQKEMAKRLNCAVVSLHQVTKVQPGEEIEAYHARDSGAVHESADIMISAWRPELKKGTIESTKISPCMKGIWRTKLLKNRYGPDGVVIDFRFSPEYLTLAPCIRKDEEVAAAVAKPVGQPQLPLAPGFAPTLDNKEKASGESIAA